MRRPMVPKPGIGWFVAIAAAALVLAFVVVSAHRPNVYLVSGDSMIPSLHDGERVEMQLESEPKHDSIVIFKQQEQWPQYTDDKHGKLVVKRIVGIPGDHVDLDEGTLFVNGEKLYELPKGYSCESNSFDKTIPGHRLFVLGDNTENSRDSLRALCLGADDPYVHTEDVQAWGKAKDVSLFSRIGLDKPRKDAHHE